MKKQIERVTMAGFKVLCSKLRRDCDLEAKIEGVEADEVYRDAAELVLFTSPNLMEFMRVKFHAGTDTRAAALFAEAIANAKPCKR